MSASNYDSEGFYVLRRKTGTMVKSSPILTAANIIRNGQQIGERLLTPIDHSKLNFPDYLDNGPVDGMIQANDFACSDSPKSWIRKAWDRTSDLEIPNPKSSTFRNSSSKALQNVVRIIISYKAGVVTKSGSGVKKTLITQYPNKNLDYIAIDTVERLESVMSGIASGAIRAFQEYYSKKNGTRIIRNYHTLKLIMVYNDASYTATVTTPRNVINMLSLQLDPATGHVTVPMKGDNR